MKVGALRSDTSPEYVLGISVVPSGYGNVWDEYHPGNGWKGDVGGGTALFELGCLPGVECFGVCPSVGCPVGSLAHPTFSTGTARVRDAVSDTVLT